MHPSTVTAIATLLLAAFATRHDRAQGIHEYDVNGTYEGELMTPWTAQFVVRDTVVSGTPAHNIAYHTRRDGDTWRYRFSATITQGESGSTVAQWTGVTREGPGTCSVVVENDTIRVADGHSVGPSATSSARAIPEFAAGYYIAGLTLTAGARVKLRLFRCSMSGRELSVFDLDATVSAGTFTRHGRSEPEPVWTVRGRSTYAYEAVISRDDGIVLKETLPQGSVGLMIQEYRLSR